MKTGISFILAAIASGGLMHLLVCNPLNLLLPIRLYWTAFALVGLTFVLLGLAKCPDESEPPYLTAQQHKELFEKMMEQQTAWMKALATVSSFILTACATYFFAVDDKPSGIGIAVAILAITATITLTSSLLHPLSDFFELSWKYQRKHAINRFLYNIRRQIVQVWHLIPFICCCAQFAAVMYIITILSFCKNG